MKLKEFDVPFLSPEQCAARFGPTLIVAPHADDESLGCGGLIALLRKHNKPVSILLLSDGTLSHPNSVAYPAERLRKLREEEFTQAAAELGVSQERLFFRRYKDRSVPGEKDAGFEAAVAHISGILQQVSPQSIFVPWRRDPHPDHRAAYQLLTVANAGAVRLYEYPIWLAELGQADDAPAAGEVTVLRVDISTVLPQKQKAIAAHRSQTTDLITDDPEGFTLSKEMLKSFDIPYETFFYSEAL